MGFCRLQPRDGTGLAGLLFLLLIACQHHLPAPEVTMSSLAPFETIPTQRLKAGQRLTLDLGLFYDLDAVRLDLVAANGIDAGWTDDTHRTLALEAASGELTGLGNIRVSSQFHSGDAEALEVDIPVAVEQSQWHVFEFRPGREVGSLTVAGDFNGWNAGAYEGLKAIEQELGAKVSHVQVQTPGEHEEHFRSYAEDGFQLVFGHGFEFQDAAKRVGREFPDTFFVTTSGNTVRRQQYLVT